MLTLNTLLFISILFAIEVQSSLIDRVIGCSIILVIVISQIFLEKILYFLCPKRYILIVSKNSIINVKFNKKIKYDLEKFDFVFYPFFRSPNNTPMLAVFEKGTREIEKCVEMIYISTRQVKAIEQFLNIKIIGKTYK